MYRHAAFLVRQAGMTHEAFVEHWQHEHTPIAREIEGVVRYLTTTPLDLEGATFDGVADLYFDDLDALHNALGGEGSRDYDPDKETAAKAREDVDNFLAVTERPRLIGEEHAHVDGPDTRYRRSILLTRRPETSHDEFRDYWLDEHVPLVRELPGLARYTATLPTAPEHAEFDGIADLYFADLDALWASTGRETDSYDPGDPEQVAVRRDATEFLDLDALRQFVGETTVQKDRPDSE